MAVLRRLTLAMLIVVALSAFLLWSDRPAARGVLDGLAEGGFTVGDSLAIERSQAEGDLATLHQIAAQVLHRNNRSRKPHVQGVVADPPARARPSW